MKIGDRIKSLREKRSWTQLELSEKIGINNSVLSRIEAGKRPVEDYLVAKFADIFEVDSDYLLGRTPVTAQSDPDIQFIMRARKDLSPKAYDRFIKLAKDMKKSFEEEDD